MQIKAATRVYVIIYIFLIKALLSLNLHQSLNFCCADDKEFGLTAPVELFIYILVVRVD